MKPKSIFYLAIFLCSCAPALPQNEASEEIKLASERAIKAAEQTAVAHSKVEASARKTEQLLQEAKSALVRANEALSLCESANSRFPKDLKPRVIYIKPKPTESVGPAAGGSVVEGAKVSGSEFSASDAPGGRYVPRGGTAAGSSSTAPASGSAKNMNAEHPEASVAAHPSHAGGEEKASAAPHH